MNRQLKSLHRRGWSQLGLLIALSLAGASASAVTLDAGSSKASTQVRCTNPSVNKVNGWLVSCRMEVTQTFNRVTWRDPEGVKSPTTTPQTCAQGMIATFDNLGYIVSCTP